MDEYRDFLGYLNENMVKLKELLERMTTLHNDAAIALLETASLYNPQILVDLTEMAVNGRKFDKLIIEGQEMKSDLEKLLSKPQHTVDRKALMDELNFIKVSLVKNFDV